MKRTKIMFWIRVAAERSFRSTISRPVFVLFVRLDRHLWFMCIFYVFSMLYAGHSLSDGRSVCFVHIEKESENVCSVYLKETHRSVSMKCDLISDEAILIYFSQKLDTFSNDCLEIPLTPNTVCVFFFCVCNGIRSSVRKILQKLFDSMARWNKNERKPPPT